MIIEGMWFDELKLNTKKGWRCANSVLDATARELKDVYGKWSDTKQYIYNLWLEFARKMDCDMYITSSNGWYFSLGMINADKGVIFYITPSHNYVIYLKKGEN